MEGSRFGSISLERNNSIDECSVVPPYVGMKVEQPYKFLVIILLQPYIVSNFSRIQLNFSWFGKMKCWRHLPTQRA